MSSVREGGTATRKMTGSAPLPGTHWVRRNGKHAGVEIEVDHSTEAGVFVRFVGEGNAMPNARADASKLNRIDLEVFKAHYVAAGELADGAGGGRAFRRQHVAKPKDTVELPERHAPLQLNGRTLALGIQVQVEEITPQLAQAWLDRGGNNRKTVDRSVTRYAAAIRRGEWMLTGDSIKIDEDGQVIDGKHRLLAVIEAGVPITTLVARGVPRATMDVIDTGRMRQPNDVLSLHGYPNAASLSAAIRALMLVEHFGHPNVGGRQVAVLITNLTILSYAEQHPEVAEGVRLANNIHQHGLAGGAGLMGACLTMFWRLDQEQTEWFAASLGSGANLDEDSAILRLRNRLTGRDYGITYDNRGREMVMALIIKSWNAWRRNEPMRALVWRESEGFPVAE